jgi:hypothetical protein
MSAGPDDVALLPAVQGGEKGFRSIPQEGAATGEEEEGMLWVG